MATCTHCLLFWGGETFSTWLFSIGFRRCDAEPCVFWRKGTFLYIHVDDIAIFSPDPETFKQEARLRFKIKDLGEANLLLGMKIEKNDYLLTTHFGCNFKHTILKPLK